MVYIFYVTDSGWYELVVQHASDIQYLHHGPGVQMADKKWRNSRYQNYTLFMQYSVNVSALVW